MQQPSENIPESEQKEQKVNNISLYGSTNPNNLKMTKKRQDFQLQKKAIAAATANEGEFEVRDDSTQSPLGLGAMKSPGGVDWDEDDMMVRSYRLPQIPVTKQTGLLSKKNRKQNNSSAKQLLQDRSAR